MSETNEENQSAGLTNEAPDGTPSLRNMKHGEESLNMLLALWNSPFESLCQQGQARILGTGKLGGKLGTIVILFDTVPESANTLKWQAD